jgi:hypothetical protein
MRGAGRLGKRMDLECMPTPTARSISVTGSMTSNRVLAKRSGPTEMHMRDSMSTGLNAVEGSLSSQMAQSTKVSSVTMTSKATGSIAGQTAECTAGSGNRTKCMATASSNGPTDEPTTASITTTKKKDSESSHGQMGVGLRGIGNKGNSTVTGSSFPSIIRPRKGNGMMGREFAG